MRFRAVVLFLGVVGCAPKAAAPPPKAPVVEEAPPPPPPKCEGIEEGCVAKEGLRTPIHPIDWTIEPPAGWKYAVEADSTVAVSDVAALAVTTFEAAKDKKQASVKASNERRAEAVARLTEKLGIVRSKKLAFPKKPHQSSKVHDVDVALYQFDKAKRSSESGPLLVFIAQPIPERTLIGVAFVAERDTTNADAAILKAIDSLAPAADDAETRAEQ